MQRQQVFYFSFILKSAYLAHVIVTVNIYAIYLEEMHAVTS